MAMCTVISLLSIGFGYAGGTKLHISDNGGGRPSEPNQYRWMISLQKNGSHYCGGFIIPNDRDRRQSDIVITAAHCIANATLNKYMMSYIIHRGHPPPDVIKPRGHEMYENMAQFRIIAGSHDIRGFNRQEIGIQIRSIVRMEMFPWFADNCSSFEHDIAIVKLNKPIVFTQRIQAIRLPRKGRVLGDGSRCAIAGWGLTEGNGAKVKRPKGLHHLNVSIVRSERCIALWKKAERIRRQKMEAVVPRFMYCVNPGRDLPSTCGGDSGGPLFCKEQNGWIAHGVSSCSDADCNGHGYKHWAPPALYTKVEPYLDWIDDKIREWNWSL